MNTDKQVKSQLENEAFELTQRLYKMATAAFDQTPRNWERFDRIKLTYDKAGARWDRRFTASCRA